MSKNYGNLPKISDVHFDRQKTFFDMISPFTATSAEYFVRLYHDARQRSRGEEVSADGTPLQEVLNDSIRKSRELLVQNQGTQIDKADSLQELLFLQTQGAKIDYIDFPISELMLSENYSVKRMAYLAASQFWEPDAEVITMVVSCINRDLTGIDPIRKSLALTLIPLIVTSSFAQDVVTNVINNFNNSRDDIRQKAITCFYKLCLKYPDCLVPGIKALNLKSALTDSSTPGGTIQAILALLNELVIHNPSNYKSLLPTLVKFFSDSQGNPWILNRTISIVGTIASTLEQSALDKFNEKITPMVSEVLNFASSPSVVFEINNLICKLNMKNRELVRTAADRAQSFIEDSDPNLRYLGLISITRLMQVNQNIIQIHKKVLTNCIDSDDETCVFIAIDLLSNVANNKNIGEIVLSILEQIEKRSQGLVRDTLVTRLIEICKFDNYSRFRDYQWYVNVLLTIHSYGVQLKEISEELLTMALRAKNTRKSLVLELVDYLKDFSPSDKEFLSVACFILGEYSSLFKNSPENLENSEDDEIEKSDKNFDVEETAFRLLCSERFEMTDKECQANSIQSAFKIYTRSDSLQKMTERSKILKERLSVYSTSRYTDVVERATMLKALIDLFDDFDDIDGLNSIYSSQLLAVDPSAQLKVKIPSTLDIATPIIELDPREESTSLELDFENESSDLFGTPLLISTSRNRNILQPQRNKTEEKTKPDLRKKLRLTPIQNDEKDELLAVEGKSEVKTGKSEVISPLSAISFNVGDNNGKELPVIKPYNQDELLYKMQKNKIELKNKQNISYNYFKVIGEHKGLFLEVSSITKNLDGVDIQLKITNSSNFPISCLEITIDDVLMSNVRSELNPNYSCDVKCHVQARESEENKLLKLVVIPTGGEGEGEVLRGKIRISPVLFLEKCQISDISDLCISSQIMKSDLPVSKIVDTAKLIFNSLMTKTDFEGNKSVVLSSKSKSSKLSCLVIIYKKDGSFFCDIRAPSENIAKLFLTELKLSLE